jgi:hypothetical protein
MGLTNCDASQITIKNQQKALYSWKSKNDTLVNLGKSVRLEQPTFQALSVVVDRRQGGCKCSTDASANPYANRFTGASENSNPVNF